MCLSARMEEVESRSFVRTFSSQIIEDTLYAYQAISYPFIVCIRYGRKNILEKKVATLLYYDQFLYCDLTAQHSCRLLLDNSATPYALCLTL